MGIAPFTVQEITESVNSDQTGCETEHEVKVYKLIDATEEIWMRAEVHLNHSEIEEV